VNRRRAIALLGSAAVFTPLVAHAQQVIPVVGILNGQGPSDRPHLLAAFRQGLRAHGYDEGRNLVFEYRFAEGRADRLPALAADLVRRRVALIAASGGSAPPLAAKSATTSIPIVFIAAEDPARAGLVASLARPGGNLTGINMFSGEVTAKRLGLLRELVPTATRVAVLANLTSNAADARRKEVEAAARTLGLRIQVFNAGNPREINAAFTAIAGESPHALFVANDPLLTSRRVQIVQLAARHSIPATYSSREAADVGGLMSYGTSIADAYRQAGIYAARILKGERPSELPVLQASKFELVINAETARMLGLTVPPMLLARADEVIE
jgi:putative ABC transport system substrate-binding protein